MTFVTIFDNLNEAAMILGKIEGIQGFHYEAIQQVLFY